MKKCFKTSKYMTTQSMPLMKLPSIESLKNKFEQKKRRKTLATKRQSPKAEHSSIQTMLLKY
jgi:hypothetical protein